MITITRKMGKKITTIKKYNFFYRVRKICRYKQRRIQKLVM
jgi:hypothetical protein